jgi:beta-galactosidase
MIGVCYYPEHWPESMWANDAKEMAELGMKYVRIAEFAWSRMEPNEGEFHFDWLDRAIDTLAAQGLQVIMCTPTATPPKWLIDKYPEILPVDINTGTVRGFGSRRHYDFSSADYLREAKRITEILVKRYGNNSKVCGWQTDNELACHDTTHSGSTSAKLAFQQWCEQRYQTIEKLNEAWGNVFWSMEYQQFSQIELPILAVTETNPSHQLAYRRFSSDQVIKFHNELIAIIKQHSNNQFITHNFIPMSDTQTDNFALAEPLDFVSYDNYPLGRSDLFFAESSAEHFKKYMRTGHPDFSSYYFDQCRGLSKGNFWIMEQQPGPVNWAHHNPKPEKGMVNLWSWQAIAHGAECVCYFRWRQAPFAQEQMHAGVKRNDNSKAAAWHEIETVRDQLPLVGNNNKAKVSANVAIITGTLHQWITEIERQGDNYNYQQVEFSYYSALRQLGLAVDFISIDSDFTQYDLIIAPCLPVVSAEFVEKCQQANAHFVFGPRSGSKTDEFQLSANLAPGELQKILPIKILSTETIRSDCAEPLQYGENFYQSSQWREELEITNNVLVLAQYHDHTPAVVRHNNNSYIATLTCENFLLDFFTKLAEELALPAINLPQDVRIMTRDNLHYVFNYSQHQQTLVGFEKAEFILGSVELPAHSVAIIKQ